MPSEADVQALVAPLRRDVVSGASVVARMGADVFRRAAARLPAASVEELRWALGEVGLAVLEAQPAMASLVFLVREVLDAVESAGDVEEGRHAAARAADAFRSSLEERSRRVASHLADHLAGTRRVLTLSSSRTVREGLLELRRRSLTTAAGPGRTSAAPTTAVSPPEVVCLESRPMQEGRILARTLAREGLAVLHAVDAAGPSLLADADAVLLGADSIGDAGVVNKIGSLALALAGRHAGIPVMVAADDSKVLPPGFPQLLDDDRPADEVWRAPPGVRVWNRYFEAVALELVDVVVTESGPMGAAAFEEARAAIPVPAGLLALKKPR